MFKKFFSSAGSFFRVKKNWVLFVLPLILGISALLTLAVYLPFALRSRHTGEKSSIKINVRFPLWKQGESPSSDYYNFNKSTYNKNKDLIYYDNNKEKMVPFLMDYTNFWQQTKLITFGDLLYNWNVQFVSEHKNALFIFGKNSPYGRPLYFYLNPSPNKNHHPSNQWLGGTFSKEYTHWLALSSPTNPAKSTLHTGFSVNYPLKKGVDGTYVENNDIFNITYWPNTDKEPTGKFF